MDADHPAFRDQCAVVAKLLFDSKQKYYSDKIQACEGNQRALFRVISTLDHGRSECEEFTYH